MDPRRVQPANLPFSELFVTFRPPTNLASVNEAGNGLVNRL